MDNKELNFQSTVQENVELSMAGSGIDPLSLYRLIIIATICLIIVYMLSGHFIEKFKILILHESTVGLLLGVLIQHLLKENKIISFDQQSFFFFLLPPIVFASAYTLQKKNFIRNIAYIMGLGVLGTIVAMIVISCILLKMNEKFKNPDTGDTWIQPAECLLLASVLASTDTVAVLTLITPDKFQRLNAVLFGEGVVNDAVTILLYQAVNRQIQREEKEIHGGGPHTEHRNDAVVIGGSDILGMVIDFFGLSIKSTLMGAVFGLTCSWILKKVNLKYDPTKECTLILMIAYLSYLCAEQCSLSGIISMFSCGLFQAHYAWYNISEASRSGSEIIVNTTSQMCQSFLYIYIGLSSFSLEQDYVRKRFVTTVLVAVLICRVFSVGVPLFLVYLSRGCKPLSLKWNEWVFIYFGGLIRGAICFGLSLQMTSDNHKVLRAAVQIIAIVTIVGVGAPLQLIAHCFSIKTDQVIKEERAQRKLDKKKRQLEMMGDDNFLKAPVDDMDGQSEGSSKLSAVQLDPNMAHTEQEQIDAIEQDFDELIKEDTYPTVIQWFRDFDTKYMIPWFKRPLEEDTPVLHEGGYSGDLDEFVKVEDEFFKVQTSEDNIELGSFRE